MSLKIALVAGEKSGDRLGARLIQALKTYYPDAKFFGIAGPEMQAEGCQTMVDMDRLSVMGLAEVLRRLPELLKIRKQLIKKLLADQPDIYIGIDAPDFNLPIARKLKRAGIKTMHFVSPSIWAWRGERVYSIGESIHHMLTLFPFEVPIYEKAGVAASFVGHPTADDIPVIVDHKLARAKLDLDVAGRYIAVLPGSRESEVKRMLPVYCMAAKILLAKYPDLTFVIPAATGSRYEQIYALLKTLQKQHGELPIQLVFGQAETVLQATNAAMVTSGTVALEALFCKQPMVVAYKVSALTYHWAKRKMLIDFVSLPNILAGRELVKERLQHDATPEQIADDVERLLVDTELREHMQESFCFIHRQLRRDASRRAAELVHQEVSKGAA
ncbi:lipid-A-disaccharide synthase [Salinibius halmophilus]|uniref:lipid-A-disaccharide synthase n=1 Tax=Salinibius halmophilus TaxID=1853216 RepID=UPI000E6721E7|nr:lipid-A-disaccharide synthase [Salinibius halmophilus]